MKQLAITVVLILVLGLCAGAVAETVDVSSMSLDELVELCTAANAELDRRTGREASIFPAGMYVTGKTIKAGNYILSCRKDLDWMQSITIATFATEEIYRQAAAENNETLAFFKTEIHTHSDGSTFVNLEDGMVLTVSEACLIEAANAEWMP